MKKLFSLALIIPIFFSACKDKCAEDTGIRVSNVNTVDQYDEMEISGPIKVVLHQDNSYSIKVEADSSIANQVKASVSRGRLSLKLDPEKYCGTDSVLVYAGIGQVKSISAEGSSELTTQGRISFGELKLSLKGNTVVEMEMSASTLITDLDGSTSLKLKGQSGVHQLKAKGSLNLDAFDFVVGKYDLNIEGSGKSNINVLNELEIETSGSSEIFYKGSPKKINKKKTGNARLEKVE